MTNFLELSFEEIKQKYELKNPNSFSSFHLFDKLSDGTILGKVTYVPIKRLAVEPPPDKRAYDVVVAWDKTGLAHTNLQSNGFADRFEQADLVRKKPKMKTVWINLYSDSTGPHYYSSEQIAIRAASTRFYLKTISVEVPESTEVLR